MLLSQQRRKKNNNLQSGVQCAALCVSVCLCVNKRPFSVLSFQLLLSELFWSSSLHSIPNRAYLKYASAHTHTHTFTTKRKCTLIKPSLKVTLSGWKSWIQRGPFVPEPLHIESEFMTAYEWQANFMRQCERGHIPPLQNRLSYYRQHSGLSPYINTDTKTIWRNFFFFCGL